MTAFVDEFRNDPTILRAALEAAVGPLPDVEVLPTGWIKVDGRLCAPSTSRALDTAREALAVFVASARIERDAAAAGQAPYLETPPNAEPDVDDPDTCFCGLPLAEHPPVVDEVAFWGRHIAEGIDDVVGFSGPIRFDVRAERCGETYPHGPVGLACILDRGHEGSHLIGATS